MKIISFAFITLCCLSTAIASAAPDKTQFRPNSSVAKAEFEKHGSARHKWKRGQVLPESLMEAGLFPDATLVWTDSYLDGGTTGYLFKDSAGTFLAVCTGPGLQTKSHPRRIDAPVGSRLFIGVLHYTKEEVEMIPPGSKAETWLRKLIDEKRVEPNSSANTRVAPHHGKS